MMVRNNAQMRQARKLIQQKRYDEAKIILRKIRHPLAKEWLANIDAIMSLKKSKELPHRYVATVG